MASKQNDRLLRIVLASIISSDLTASELRRLSIDIQNGSFVDALGRTLADISFALEREPFGSPSQHHGDLDAVMRIIKNRRVSKNKLRSVMSRLAPASLMRDFSDDLTVREMVEDYLRAVPFGVDVLVDALSEDGSDEFLKGILKGRGS